MRHIQARSRRLFDRQGRVVRILGVNHDVTELVHTQQRLKTEQCRLSTSLDALLDPHLMLSPVRDDAGSIVDLRIARANPAAVASKRMTRDAFVGSTQLQFWPGHLENGLFDRYR